MFHRRIRSVRRQRGFTLIELLVAVTLLSIVMAALYSAFSSTIQMWKRGETNFETYQDARLALSILSRELQNVVAGSEYMFTGTKDSLTFYAAITPMDVDEGEHTRLAQITYRLKQDPAQHMWSLVREESIVEGTLPVVTKDSGDLDSSALKLGKEHLFDLVGKVWDFKLTYLWLRPTKGGPATLSASDAAGAAAPGGQGGARPASGNSTGGGMELVEKDDNPRGTGLPAGVRVTLVVDDETKPRGRTTFTDEIVFSTPTTPYEAEDSLGLGSEAP